VEWNRTLEVALVLVTKEDVEPAAIDAFRDRSYTLRERLASSGLSEADAARWVDEAGKLCAGHLAGGSAGLPWAHAFGGAGPVRVLAETVLAVTARAMDEAVKALEARWPGYFTA